MENQNKPNPWDNVIPHDMVQIYPMGLELLYGAMNNKCMAFLCETKSDNVDILRTEKLV